jgi:hypothetical protein
MSDTAQAAAPRPIRESSLARAALLVAATLALAGCQAVGPVSVSRDRLDYADAIARSWQQQTLLNIVKLRYLDTPVYLDISSVVSSYELTREVNLTASVFPNDRANTSGAFGASGTYSETPTISYTLLTGEKLVDSLLRPLPPDTIFAMINSGHPADYILRASVRAIDGIFNGSDTYAGARPEDPRFVEVIGDIRRIELDGALGVRFEKHDDEVHTFLSLREHVNADGDRAIDDLKHVLGIPANVDELRVVSGLVPRKPDELAMLTRPMQRLLSELSAGVDVPAADVKAGRATPLPPRGPGSAPQLVHIRSGNERPAHPFVAVRYRGHWFWVDDSDLESKRMFMFLMMFSSLSESGAVPQAPILTIPAR